MAEMLGSRSTTPTPTPTSFRFRVSPVLDSEHTLPASKGPDSDGAVAAQFTLVHRALEDPLASSPTTGGPTVMHGVDGGSSPPCGPHGGMSHTRSASGPTTPVSSLASEAPLQVPPHPGQGSSLSPGTPHDPSSPQKTMPEVQRVVSLPELGHQSSSSPHKPTPSPLHTATVLSISAVQPPSQPDLFDGPQSPKSPLSPASALRARSMNDLVSEISNAIQQTTSPVSPSPEPFGHKGGPPEIQVHHAASHGERKEPDLFRWSKVDDLTDKMLWLAITGSDQAYIRHFLLMYRKFATPRSIILCMQRRLRFLDTESQSDPLFAGFGQLRICRLLETWKNAYPTDFAVPGTEGAFTALLKFIMSKSHLLHMASVFVPFMNNTSELVDPSAGWAMKADIMGEDNDDRYTITDLEDRSIVDQPASLSSEPRSSSDFLLSKHESSTSSARARTSSLPLPLLTAPPSTTRPPPDLDPIAKLVRDLLRTSHHLDFFTVADIAEELTNIELQMFLAIKPRDWLSHIFLSGKKDPEICPVAKMGSQSNRLAEWVASMILCHEKPKSRAKQITRFVEISQRLREMKNYSSLRSILAGIHASMIEGDTTNEQFARQSPQLYKKFLSLASLVQQGNAHRAYRTALKTTEGARIPAVIIHVSDLLRANDGNPDWHPQDSTLLHWAKFNMLGKFVDTLTECQDACRSSDDYAFKRHDEIRKLIEVKALMDPEMQYSRLNLPPDLPTDGTARPNLVNAYLSESTARRESAFLRKLFSR